MTSLKEYNKKNNEEYMQQIGRLNDKEKQLVMDNFKIEKLVKLARQKNKLNCLIFDKDCTEVYLVCDSIDEYIAMDKGYQGKFFVSTKDDFFAKYFEFYNYDLGKLAKKLDMEEGTIFYNILTGSNFYDYWNRFFSEKYSRLNLDKVFPDVYYNDTRYNNNIKVFSELPIDKQNLIKSSFSYEDIVKAYYISESKPIILFDTLTRPVCMVMNGGDTKDFMNNQIIYRTPTHLIEFELVMYRFNISDMIKPLHYHTLEFYFDSLLKYAPKLETDQPEFYSNVYHYDSFVVSFNQEPVL